MRDYLLALLCQITSLLFGRTSAKITSTHVTFKDGEAKAMVYRKHPKWCTWMVDSEEEYRSDYGIIWYGKYSGRADILGLNSFLGELHIKARLFAEDTVTEDGEIIH